MNRSGRGAYTFFGVVAVIVGVVTLLLGLGANDKPNIVLAGVGVIWIAAAIIGWIIGKDKI